MRAGRQAILRAAAIVSIMEAGTLRGVWLPLRAK